MRGRKRQAQMLQEEGGPTSMARKFEVVRPRAHSRDVLLDELLPRVRHREEVNIEPQPLERENLVEDERLRQAGVAAQDVADVSVADRRGRAVHARSAEGAVERVPVLEDREKLASPLEPRRPRLRTALRAELGADL
jgi:hypothetical protein